MNKNNHEKSARVTEAVEPKQCEEAFKREAVEH